MIHPLNIWRYSNLSFRSLTAWPSAKHFQNFAMCIKTVELSVDVETFSSEDLRKKGVYKYIESEDFEMLMLTISVDGINFFTLDLLNKQCDCYNKFTNITSTYSFKDLLSFFLSNLNNPIFLKTAFNAAFEILTLRQQFCIDINARQWCCTMVKCGMLGLPMSLDKVATVLNLGDTKDKNGESCINYFSKPCKASKTNGNRKRNLPSHNLEKWKEYLLYNRQDVIVEIAIREKVSFFEKPLMEQELWVHDRELNDRGIYIDQQLASSAVKLFSDYAEQLKNVMRDISGVANPKSNAQLKTWLKDVLGYEIKSLNKLDIPKILASTNDEDVHKIIELRKELSKASVLKFKAMMNAVCKDGKAHGIIKLYGANRTGRYASNLIQTQNMTKNKHSKGLKIHEIINDLTIQRSIVCKQDPDLLTFMCGDIAAVLSGLVRTALVPSPDHEFIVSDLSAIEARVIAWLAGEQWVLDAFEAGEDIYVATASRIFKVSKEQAKEEYRPQGKLVVLSCGYMGSVGAMVNSGAIRDGICDEEIAKGYQEYLDGVEIEVKDKKGNITKRLKYPKWDDEAKIEASSDLLLSLVKFYRENNPNIVKYWYFLEEQIKEVIRTKERRELTQGMYAYYKKGILFIRLPSGRDLAYFHAKLEMVKKIKKGRKSKGEADVETLKETIVYMGIDQDTKKWGKVYSYSGKFAENLSQAIARDVICTQMLRMRAKGHKTVFHVHDEVANEAPIGSVTGEEIDAIMSQPISWAPGLPLAATGFVSPFYLKD